VYGWTHRVVYLGVYRLECAARNANVQGSVADLRNLAYGVDELHLATGIAVALLARDSWYPSSHSTPIESCGK
jgi:hypothetical protein